MMMSGRGLCPGPHHRVCVAPEEGNARSVSESDSSINIQDFCGGRRRLVVYVLSLAFDVMKTNARRTWHILCFWSRRFYICFATPPPTPSACDPRLASVQVSLVDTAADQGALEVAPGTQRGGAPAGEGEGTVVAVPAGTVLFYAPSASHRGRGNRLGRDRLFLGLTLLGEGGVVPPGIPYALQPHDLGRWCLRGGGDEAAA